MASRDNQTLQISLMVFAILVVVFAGMTYWSYSNWQKANAEIEGLNKTVQDTKNNASTHIVESEEIKKMLGFKPEENLDAIKKHYKKDMGIYAVNFEAAQRNYLHIIANFWDENNASSRSETVAKEETKALKEKLLELEGIKKEAIAKFENEAKKANLNASGERTKFNGAREAWKTAMEKITQEMDKIREDLEAKIVKKDADIAKRDAELVVSLKRVKDLKDILDINTGNNVHYADADGLITEYSPIYKIVYINLGFAEGLKPQVTFSVYPEGELIKTLKIKDSSQGKRYFKSGDDIEEQPTPIKAKIEVIKVINAHTSVCKITSSSPLGDPILSGDQIYTPGWHAGKKLHYAICGEPDIDDDGKSDLDQLLGIIRLNGGVVDLYVDKKGEMQGELTIHTKYLIIGKTPLSTSQAYTSMTNARADAAKLDVDTIPVAKFLDLIGWDAGARSVKLGSGVEGSDFKARFPGNVQKTDIGGSTSGLYRKRQPRLKY